MILENLRKETSAAHKELEEINLLKPLSKGRLTKDQYIVILKSFYSFFAPLEDQILSFKDVSLFLADISERRKSSWILEDLNFFDEKDIRMIVTNCRK